MLYNVQIIQKCSIRNIMYLSILINSLKIAHQVTLGHWSNGSNGDGILREWCLLFAILHEWSGYSLLHCNGQSDNIIVTGSGTCCHARRVSHGIGFVWWWYDQFRCGSRQQTCDPVYLIMMDFDAGVALALKFTGSRKIFADPFKSTKNNF